MHPKADLEDPAAKPKGRILGAIKKAFQKLFQRGAETAAAGEVTGKKGLVDVPHRTQVGGTCGIAALGMVLDYWKAKDSTQLAPSDEEIKEMSERTPIILLKGPDKELDLTQFKESGADLVISRPFSMHLQTTSKARS